MQVLDDDCVLLIRDRDHCCRVNPVRILDLALGPAAAGVEQVAQDGHEPGREIGAGLELFLLADRPEHGLLHEILGTRDVMGERDRESPQRFQAAHEFVEKGLVHGFRVGPDDLRHPIEEPGQVLGQPFLVRIAVEGAQLTSEMDLDGLIDNGFLGGHGGFDGDLAHVPSDVTVQAGVNRAEGWNPAISAIAFWGSRLATTPFKALGRKRPIHHLALVGIG